MHKVVLTNLMLKPLEDTLVVSIVNNNRKNNKVVFYLRKSSCKTS